ncbi:hypothetical protein HGRIS_013799 [Hohenbuehelia grisea]|uniref:Nephrocystin 3-like N-terminal domain-containing protein n=1 Tax=Hohenbuehelia grisea TaxID=104357 RepID=A0ABR3IWQ3_9AGAR
MLGQLVSCMQGTRTGLLAEIQGWIQRLGSEQVFWVKGRLGTGKTTIAHTIAKHAQDAGLLGANFFFSRFDESLHDPRLIFPTIAYHLSRFHPAFKQAIISAVAADPDIAHLQPANQFDLLLRRAATTLNDVRHPIVFVFDALDEFERGIGSFRDVMYLFIHGLATLSPNIRIFVTSRPEPYIDCLMRSVTTRGLPIRVYDLDRDPETRDDIRTYLRTGLVQISASWCLGDDENQWYTADEYRQLVSRACNSFVYASAALRFIADPVAYDPRGQLDVLLGARPATSSSNPNPHSALDNLYMLVLQRAYPESHETSEATLEMLRSILAHSGVVTNLTHSDYSDDMISHFISCTRVDFSRYLRHLGAIFSTREDGFLVPHHWESFTKFLTSRKRCFDLRFFVDRNRYQLRLAFRCFETVKRCYTEHMSDLPIVPSMTAAAVPPHTEAVSPQQRGVLVCFPLVDTLDIEM